MEIWLLLLSMVSGATLVTKQGTGFDFKEGTAVKASITPGGFLKPASVATSALPTTCLDGSLVWDSTAHAVKYCSGNSWSAFGSTPGATPPTCSAGSVAVSYNGSSWTCVSSISEATTAGSATTATTCSTASTATSATSATTASALASDPTACAAGSYVTDMSAAGVLTCATPAVPATTMLASDYTTTNSKANTGLGWTVGAGKVVQFWCFLEVRDQAAAVGMSLQLASSQTLGRVFNRSLLYKTSATALTSEVLTALTSTIPAAACAASCITTSKGWELSGVMQGHATLASDITIKASSSTGGAKVMAGSFCTVNSN